MGLLLAACLSSPRPRFSPCGAERLGKEAPPWTVRSAGAVDANGSSGGPNPAGSSDRPLFRGSVTGQVQPVSQEPDHLSWSQPTCFLRPHSSGRSGTIGSVWVWLPLPCPQSLMSVPHQAP